MARKDKYHDIVRSLLETDGWTITHDPYFVRLGKRKGFIDLGAERLIIGAEKGSEILVYDEKQKTIELWKN